MAESLIGNGLAVPITLDTSSIPQQLRQAEDQLQRGAKSMRVQAGPGTVGVRASGDLGGDLRESQVEDYVVNMRRKIARRVERDAVAEAGTRQLIAQGVAVEDIPMSKRQRAVYASAEAAGQREGVNNWRMWNLNRLSATMKGEPNIGDLEGVEPEQATAKGGRGILSVLGKYSGPVAKLGSAAGLAALAIGGAGMIAEQQRIQSDIPRFAARADYAGADQSSVMQNARITAGIEQERVGLIGKISSLLPEALTGFQHSIERATEAMGMLNNVQRTLVSTGMDLARRTATAAGDPIKALGIAQKKDFNELDLATRQNDYVMSEARRTGNKAMLDAAGATAGKLIEQQREMKKVHGAEMEIAKEQRAAYITGIGDDRMATMFRTRAVQRGAAGNTMGQTQDELVAEGLAMQARHRAELAGKKGPEADAIGNRQIAEERLFKAQAGVRLRDASETRHLAAVTTTGEAGPMIDAAATKAQNTENLLRDILAVLRESAKVS